MTISPGKVVPNDDVAELSAEEAAEIDAALEEAEQGGGISAEELLRELRAIRDEEIARRRP